jgi:ABC-type glycerol-3-phosphate transport system substrate-binding protein
MRTLIAVAAAAVLAGCGADVATSAATAAQLKKQELEQGQQTKQMMQQKIDAAMQQVRQRAASDAQQ